jgi:hypothetical protein
MSDEKKGDRRAYITWTAKKNDVRVVYASGPCEAARRWMSMDLVLGTVVPFNCGSAISTVFVTRADGHGSVTRVKVVVGMSDTNLGTANLEKD